MDDNSLPLSIASAISFLKPVNQDEVLHLSDLGYKITTERVERMKKVEKAGNLDEQAMREILEDKDLAPKHTAPPPAPQPPTPPPTPTGGPSVPPPIPPSPDLKPPQTAGTPAAPNAPGPSAPSPAPSANLPAPETTVPSSGPAAPPAGPTNPPEEKPPFKGEQERPEYTKVILAGDRLRKYFPDVSMTPREIEESVYDALKGRGFKWARSVGAWQRQLTDNAIYAASRVKAIQPSDGSDPIKIQPKRKPKTGPQH